MSSLNREAVMGGFAGANFLAPDIVKSVPGAVVAEAREPGEILAELGIANLAKMEVHYGDKGTMPLIQAMGVCAHIGKDLESRVTSAQKDVDKFNLSGEVAEEHVADKLYDRLFEIAAPTNSPDVLEHLQDRKKKLR